MEKIERAIVRFATEVASKCGYVISVLDHNADTKEMVLQPLTILPRRGPDQKMVQHFTSELCAQQQNYALPVALHIEAINEVAPPSLFDEAEHLPSEIHKVRISYE